MTITEAFLQGMIQGLTEFLPVSSSGHLSLYQYFTGNSSESSALFSVVLHLGTLFAVFVAFWGTIRPLLLESFALLGDLVRGRFSRKDQNPYRRMILLLLVSLLPLALTFLLKEPMRLVASDRNILVEGLCFLVTAALLLLADRCPSGKTGPDRMSYRAAATVGLMQAIAPLPGVSRSGSTLSVGMILGLEPRFALDFSFIMGIPAVIGALILDGREVLEGGLSLPPLPIAAGLLASLVFGLLAIWLLRRLVNARRLRWFGYYTLALGLVTVAVGAVDLLAGYPVQNALLGLLAG